MNTASFAPVLSSASKLFGVGILCCLPLSDLAAADLADVDSAAVVYEASADEGSECLMVFATVGQPFRYEIAGIEAAEPADCSRGVDAHGDRSRLPRGLRFDKRALSLEGVPAEPGFHEFVALVTERGVTRERVILIDVAESRSARSLDSFASYFLGGAR